MAANRYSVIRVGIVIAIGIVIGAVAIFSIGQGTKLFKGGQVFEAHFHRTNGLQTGAPVSLSGVNIGTVESIHFPRDPFADYVIVGLWVEDAAAPRVHVDSVALIESMGLLGDKFLELTPGTPSAHSAPPGYVLRSEDPIDYEALLRRTGAGDFIANVVDATNSLRIVLDQLEHGHGLLGELLRGEAGQKFSMASVTKTLDHVDRLTIEMNETINRLNHGNSLAAAMLSKRVNGRLVVSDLAASAASLKDATARLASLTTRLEKAQGTVPRLVEDRRYADEILPQLKQSTHDLQEILQKINNGQGTLGQMVNDPALYNEAKGMFSGGGWGLSLLHGIYGITHPFHSPESGNDASVPGQPSDLRGSSRPAVSASPAAAPTSGSAVQ